MKDLKILLKIAKIIVLLRLLKEFLTKMIQLLNIAEFSNKKSC